MHSYKSHSSRFGTARFHPGLRCPHCGATLPPISADLSDFLDLIPVTCEACGERVIEIEPADGAIIDEAAE